MTVEMPDFVAVQVLIKPETSDVSASEPFSENKQTGHEYQCMEA